MCQGGAALERIRSNSGDAVRQDNTCKACTITKCVDPHIGHTVRNGDTGQIEVSVETTAPDLGRSPRNRKRDRLTLNKVNHVLPCDDLPDFGGIGIQFSVPDVHALCRNGGFDGGFGVLDAGDFTVQAHLTPPQARFPQRPVPPPPRCLHRK